MTDAGSGVARLLNSTLSGHDGVFSDTYLVGFSHGFYLQYNSVRLLGRHREWHRPVPDRSASHANVRPAMIGNGGGFKSGSVIDDLQQVRVACRS